MRIRVYGFVPLPEDFRLPDDPEAAVAAVLEQLVGWSAWQRRQFEVADRSAIYQCGLYELPAGHSWPHHRGVTLLGDAMNLMTTHAGKGTNVAMWDALELGLNIAKACEEGWEMNLDDAVAEYEARMCVVAGKAAQESHDNMMVVRADGCARRWIELAKRSGIIG